MQMERSNSALCVTLPMDGRKVCVLLCVLTYACGEGGVRGIARFTCAPVAAHSVHTLSIGTNAAQLTLIQI